MAGYCPENTTEFRSLINEYMETLRDPTLPLIELKEVLAAIACHLPVHISVEIRRLMCSYERNLTSIFVQFPCQQIATVIDQYAASLPRPQDRCRFLEVTIEIVRLIQRYSQGLRGRMRAAVHDILESYYCSESAFIMNPHRTYNQVIAKLLESHAAHSVTAAIFSHRQLEKKSKLVIELLEHLQHHEPGISEDVANDLNRLTELSASSMAEHYSVAVRARRLVMAAHQPTFEIRHRQIETILWRSVNVYEHDYHPENLRRLVQSEVSIFDVLHIFFYHVAEDVRRAAIEVYIRRAYISYRLKELDTIDCWDGTTTADDDGKVIGMYFQFCLPHSHPNRVENEQNGFRRNGWMLAFQSVAQFEANFNSIKILVEAKGAVDSNNILNIAIRRLKVCSDEELAIKFETFCKLHKSNLLLAGIRRITFLISMRFALIFL